MSNKKKVPSARMMAKRITAALFRHGANRLVLEKPDKTDVGGWCKGAVEDQVFDTLVESGYYGTKVDFGQS